MPRIIAISNQKGGVGKTTTAVNLGAALARAGHATLLVDLDAQGNASSGVGFPKDRVDIGVADAVLGLQPLRNTVVHTGQTLLDLVPATAALVGVEVELVNLANRERRLLLALADLPRNYEYVLIDCPPSLGLLTVNALVAANGVLIPLAAEYYAMEGLGELIRTIAAMRRGPNPKLVRDGIVITLADPRTNLCKEVERQAREVFGDEVFGTVVPRNVRLAEAPSFGKSIFTYDAASKGAAAYAALADEVLRRTAGGAMEATA